MHDCMFAWRSQDSANYFKIAIKNIEPFTANNQWQYDMETSDIMFLGISTYYSVSYL